MPGKLSEVYHKPKTKDCIAELKEMLQVGLTAYNLGSDRESCRVFKATEGLYCI